MWALLLMMVVGSVSAEANATPQKCTYCSTVHALVEAAKSPIRKKASGRPVSLALVSKKPNDAPDFDYRQRIHEAQALLAAQPVLKKDDMQFENQGALSHFNWLLAVGRKGGPLTVLRMDEAGKNEQGFTVTWPADNFINTHFRVTKPEGYIVFAQRRPVHAKVGYQEAVYSAYTPELDTKIMRDAGMNYLRSLQHQAYDQIKTYDVRSRVAPGTTVILAEIDPLRSECEMLATRLKDAGSEVDVKIFDGVTHEFFGMGLVVGDAMSAEKMVANGLKKAFGTNTLI